VAESKLVDSQGYRPNVGMVICNRQKQLFWAKRSGMTAWQFPQGGIHPGEDLDEAMYRELYEEVGLHPDDVVILGQTEEWVKYLFGSEKTTSRGETYVGQKQIWFLLQLISPDDYINIAATEHQEFDAWKWVDFWYPVEHIVEFKREIYQDTLTQFAPILFDEQAKG
jgi:putative (di)nucleoside polyphosphate hydrolase